LTLATSKHVLIKCDTYFFGSQTLATKSSLNYVLADLDHVFILPERSQNELLKNNMVDFSIAMGAFLEHFVTNKNRSVYLAALDKFNRPYGTGETCA
jgi:hypothetical protein